MPGNRGDVVPWGEEPGECDLSGCRPGPLRDGFDFVDDPQVLVEVTLDEAGVGPAKIFGVLLARRGNVDLATEIALASVAQVAAFLIPVVALISWAIDPLASASGRLSCSRSEVRRC